MTPELLELCKKNASNELLDFLHYQRIIDSDSESESESESESKSNSDKYKDTINYDSVIVM